MIEELGEFTHAYLKKSQGIRVGEKHDENLIDACCDMATSWPTTAVPES